MKHVLFLSHAGADTEPALRLAERIEESEAARQAGLRVWIDKRSLAAGLPWQDQLDKAIAQEATAFAVYVPNTGAENWVLTEIRAALDRVIAENRAGRVFPFIPILAEKPEAIANLPTFAQQYQGIVLTEGDAAIQKVIAAVIGALPGQPVPLVAEPFVDLSAFEASQAHLFFGREQDTAELLERLRTTSILAIVGDSGAGKSSVVKAGVVPAFRDGKLASQNGPRPDSRLWHVIEMRPRGNPFENLIVAITNGARNVSVNADMLSNAISRLRKSEPGAVRDAIREGAPANAQVLLVVDQFEELWTQTFDATVRTQFLDALIALAPKGDTTNRLVLTMRRDYYFQCAAHPAFLERLESDDRRGLYSLRRMRDDQLRDCIEKPLALAGVATAEARALATEVLRDAGDQPGDLALIEVALTRTWQLGKNGSLLDAYKKIGRVDGALEQAARQMLEAIGPERVRDAETLFMRLVTQSVDGSVTRRVARKREFAPDVWHLAQDLAKAEFSRLVVIGEATTGDNTVELAHEQLAARWSQYLSWLREPRERVEHKRTLDWLMDDAARWIDTRRGWGDVASGRKLVDVRALRQAHDSWLSGYEQTYVSRSNLKAASLKIIGVAVVATLLASTWAMQVETRRREIGIFASGIWDALEFSQQQPTPEELDALDRLRNAGDDERFAFLDLLRTREATAQRFLRQPDLVTRAAVAADLDVRDRAIRKLIESGPDSAEPDSARRLGLAMLGSQLGNFSGWQRVFDDHEHASTYQQYTMVTSRDPLEDVLAAMPPEQSKSFVDGALVAMEANANSSPALIFYARVLSQVKQKLTLEQSKRAFAAMRGIYGRSITSEQDLQTTLWYITRSMPLEVDVNLAEQVFEVSQTIPEETQNNGAPSRSQDEIFERSSFVDEIVAKVPPEHAREVIRAAIAAMDRAASATPKTEPVIARSLGGLSVAAGDARKVIAMLSAKLDRTSESETTYALSRVLEETAKRVPAEDSAAVSADLVALMNRHALVPETVGVSISAIASLPGPIDGQTANAVIGHMLPLLNSAPSLSRTQFQREIQYTASKVMEHVSREGATEPFNTLLVALEGDPSLSLRRAILINMLAELNVELDRPLALRTFNQLLPMAKNMSTRPNSDSGERDLNISYELGRLTERVTAAARKDVALLLLGSLGTPVNTVIAQRLSFSIERLQEGMPTDDQKIVVGRIVSLMNESMANGKAFAALHDSIYMLSIHSEAERRISELLPAAIEMNKDESNDLEPLLKIRVAVHGDAPSLDEALKSAATHCESSDASQTTGVVAQSVLENYSADRIVTARSILAAMEKRELCAPGLRIMANGLRTLTKTEEMPAILEITLTTMERNEGNAPLLMELAGYMMQPEVKLPPGLRPRLDAIVVSVLSSDAHTVEALSDLGLKFSNLPLELNAEQGRKIMRRYVAAIRTNKKDTATSYLINSLLAIASRVPDDESVAQTFVVALQNPWSGSDASILEAMQTRFPKDLPNPLYKWDAIRWAEAKYGTAT